MTPASWGGRRLAACAGAALAALLAAAIAGAQDRGEGGVVGDAPRVITAHPEPGADAREGSHGSIDASAVASVIRRRMGRIRRCYLDERRRQPGLEGLLEVHITIGRRGRVTALRMGGTMEQRAPAVGRCVGTVLRAMRFPAPEEGEEEFPIPFRFRAE